MFFLFFYVNARKLIYNKFVFLLTLYGKQQFTWTINN